MESHKRILGILYIVSGSFQLVTLALVYVFLSSFFPFIAKEVDSNMSWVMDMIGSIVPGIFLLIILLFSLPSIIGGIAILQGKTWALMLLLIMGCFKLFSFPIGTALGVYTIWVYAESSKIDKANTQAHP